MTPAARPVTLARHYLRWLMALYGTLAALIIGAALVFVMWPMAQRSADDLAGLMQLSAQTWAELPPETRAAFEQELLRSHRLAIRPGMPPPPDTGMVHGFYIRFLEQALARQLGRPAFLANDRAPNGDEWMWTSVTAGGQPIGIGFDYARLHTQPLVALVIVVVTGALLVSVAAVWLARRIGQPIAKLERAAAELATGASPHLLPETGPAELARLAGHFNRMALHVRELLDARTTLFAGISHDLRTPLARIRLALEMLTIRPDPSLITRIEGDVAAMNVLIGQMLDLARGIGGEAGQSLELEPWLHQRVRMHEGAAAQTGSTLAVVCPAGLRIFAAPGVLGRIVDNLLGNALRYAPGQIELCARILNDGPSGTVRVSVRDHGPGIEAGQLEAVWRPFQRVEGSRSPRTGGYGLGLAIVRQLAQAQRWHVALGAAADGGIEACVDVPAHAPPAAEAGPGGAVDPKDEVRAERAVRSDRDV